MQDRPTDERELKNERIVIKVLQCMIGLGVVLAIVQFALNRGFWCDEAMLALNILDGGFADMLVPLNYNQVAPIGFLLTTELIVSTLGNSELVYRIVPFLAYLGALPLLFKVSKSFTRSLPVSYAIVAFYACSVKSVYFASEFKQYSTDAFIALLIWHYILTISDRDNFNTLKLSLLGIVAVWFSNAAVIILLVAGLYLLFKKWRTGNRSRLLLAIGGWVLSFGVYFGLFIHNHPTKDFMLMFWQKEFLPMNPMSADFYSFIWEKYISIFSLNLSFDFFWPIPAVIVLLGTMLLIKQRKFAVLYITITPLLIHLGLSGVKMYPFATRLMLYTNPFIIALIIYSGYLLAEAASKGNRKLMWTALVLPGLFALVVTTRKTPYKRDQVRELVEILNDKIRPNDEVFAYRIARPGLLYYARFAQNVNESDQIRFDRNVDYSNEDIRECVGGVGTKWILFHRKEPVIKKKFNYSQYALELFDKAGYTIEESYILDVSAMYKLHLGPEE